MSEVIKEIVEGTIELPELLCKRCGHKWHPRTSVYPKVCPKCKSVYWNRERIRRDSDTKG